MISLILSISRFFVGICGFTFSFIILQNTEKKSSSRYFGISEFFLGIWMSLAAFQEAYKWFYLDKPMVLASLIGAEYLCAELAVVSIFYFVIYFGKINSHRKTLPNIALYIIPFIFTISFLICHLFFDISPFFNTSITIDPETVIGGYIFPKRLIYYIHCYYCYSLLGILVIMFLFKAITNFREYKKVMLFFASGVIIFLVPNMNWFIKENFFLASHENALYIIDTISMLFMMTASFFVFIFDEREQSVILCKKQIFNYSKLPIFIFSKDDKLIEASLAATDMLSTYQIFAKKFDKFEKVFPADKVQQLGVATLPDEKNVSYFSFNQDKKLFFARKIHIKSSKSKVKSYYLIFSRMDFYAESVRHLEQTAFTDSISGFKKKTSLIQQIFNDISMHSRAICLVTLSLNHFDELWEKNGFDGTNRIISAFSKNLKASIPETDSIFRLSDSAFSFILPETMTEKIPSIFSSIKKSCMAFSTQNDLSVSIGYTVSTPKDTENIDNFIEKSFQNMLLDRKKQLLKKQNSL